MGACASFPRGMKPTEASEAPAPEPAPEQSVKSAESTEEVKLEHDEKKDDEAKQPSLGSLLDEKEEAVNDKKANEEVAVKPKEAEQKTKEAPTPKKTEETKDSMEKNEKEGKKDY